jgi:NAD(P)-dependent dehydrogenase (short-subunit alcohol dehydrogenase family)
LRTPVEKSHHAEHVDMSISPKKRFAGKVALVTGAASGIGAQTARSLAAAGAHVVVADRDDPGAREVAREIGGAAMVLDVTDAAAVEQAIADILRQLGRLELAVNNAGVGSARKPLADTTLEDWRHIVSTNLDAVFYCMKYELAAMRGKGGGAIVNVASMMGVKGYPGASAYVAAKHGVVGLTRSAALDHAADGIRINAVGPGFVDTPMAMRGRSLADREAIARMHPLGRLAQPDDVAELILFLLSDSAAFITGTFHLVDGGFTA